MRSIRVSLGVVFSLFLAVGVACSDDDGEDATTDDNMNGQMDASMDVPDGEPMCEPVAIPCCNDAGEQITFAQCTFDGLQCPAGLTELNCYDGGLQDVDQEDTGQTEDAGDGSDVPDAN